MPYTGGAKVPDIRRTQSGIRNSQFAIPYCFCTYFDRHYLTRGLALYESLVRHCQRPFVLWILCFDNETYAILRRLNLPGVRLISQQEFEAGDEELARTKATRSRVEYYWTCTPSLPLYVLRQDPKVNLITYLDADLFFFSDPQPIYDEFGAGSILIIGHRYGLKHAHHAATKGSFNVGVMAFRRDENGLACLQWWRERCLEWCYARVEDGKFGDQKYLDDWPQRFRGVVVVQQRGAGSAPWNLTNHDIVLSRQGIQYDGEPLVFFHFHGFKFVSTNLVEPLSSEYALSAAQAAGIFLPYAHALRRAAELARLSCRDGFVPTPPRRELWDGALRRCYLLVRPAWLSVMLWRFGIGRLANEARVTAGFGAYASGDAQTMRRRFLGAVYRNPFLLRNLGIVSLVLESFLGKERMMLYRTWRRRLTGKARIAR